MHKTNSILMQAPKIAIFEAAANLELLAKNLSTLPLHPFSRAGTRSQHGDHGGDAFRHSDLLDIGANIDREQASKYISHHLKRGQKECVSFGHFLMRAMVCL